MVRFFLRQTVAAAAQFFQATPAALGLVVTLICNLADTYFIAQTGDTALVAGVSVCPPVFTTLMAFGNIFGQGGSSLISRLLGRQDRTGAAQVSAFCFYAAGGMFAAVVLLLTVLFQATGQIGPAFALSLSRQGRKQEKRAERKE